MAQSGTTDLGANIGGSGGGGGGVTSLNGLAGALSLIPGAGITITPGSSTITIAVTNPGTVSNFSFVNSNGFAGTVANPTTTPALTLTTSVTGILYGNGTSMAAAIPANFPTLNQNTTGTAGNITAATNSTLTTLTALNLPTSQLLGDVSLTTQVSGTLPIANGGTNATTVAGARSSLGIDAGVSFLTSGTNYTTPVSITTSTIFKFTLIGGGAGGAYGTVAADANAGGGGGAAVIVYATGLSPSTSYTITIGSGGLGGVESSTTPPTAGGNTTISLDSITYTAGGGNIPATDADTSPGGVGGMATNTFGTGFSITGVNINGGPGRGASTLITNGGEGGASGGYWGAGGQSLKTATTNGNPGTGYGSGGGGGSGLTGNGGAGAQGAILVEYHN